MNMAAFAVIVARERETDLGDSIAAMRGLGRERPLLAWPMTLSMLGLAGIPATAGFIGKFYLIDAAVSRRLHMAGSRDRDRLDDLARLLPAGDRRDVDERRPGRRGSPRTATPSAPPAPGRPSRARRRLARARRAHRPSAARLSRRSCSSRCWAARRASSSASSPSRCSTSCTGSGRRWGCCETCEPPAPRVACASMWRVYGGAAAPGGPSNMSPDLDGRGGLTPARSSRALSELRSHRSPRPDAALCWRF